MYRDLPMSQRLDKIGELLAKGVYLYMKKERSSVNKQENEHTNNSVRLKTHLPKKLWKRKIPG